MSASKAIGALKHGALRNRSAFRRRHASKAIRVASVSLFRYEANYVDMKLPDQWARRQGHSVSGTSSGLGANPLALK